MQGFFIELNDDSNLCAIHANLVILQLNHLRIAVKLRRDEGKMRAHVKWTDQTKMECVFVYSVVKVAINIEDLFIVRLYHEINRASNC